jgi:hypothetical protein
LEFWIIINLGGGPHVSVSFPFWLLGPITQTLRAHHVAGFHRSPCGEHLYTGCRRSPPPHGAWCLSSALGNSQRSPPPLLFLALHSRPSSLLSSTLLDFPPWRSPMSQWSCAPSSTLGRAQPWATSLPPPSLSAPTTTKDLSSAGLLRLQPGHDDTAWSFACVHRCSPTRSPAASTPHGWEPPAKAHNYGQCTSMSFRPSKPPKSNRRVNPMLVEPFPTGHKPIRFGRKSTGDAMERGSSPLAVGPEGQSGSSHFFTGGASSCRCSLKQQYSLFFSIWFI